MLTTKCLIADHRLSDRTWPDFSCGTNTALLVSNDEHCFRLHGTSHKPEDGQRKLQHLCHVPCRVALPQNCDREMKSFCPAWEHHSQHRSCRWQQVVSRQASGCKVMRKSPNPSQNVDFVVACFFDVQTSIDCLTNVLPTKCDSMQNDEITSQRNSWWDPTPPWAKRAQGPLPTQPTEELPQASLTAERFVV